LQPGERIELIAVKKGDQVKKGDLLVQLANDDLLEHRSLLQEKRFKMMQTSDKIRLLDARIKTLTHSIDQLEKKIADEQTVLKKLADYETEKDLMQWTENLQRKKDQLSVIKTEHTIAIKQLGQQAEIETTYAELSKQLDRQRNALTVQAPFSGTIVFTGHNYGRATVGEKVLELRDDQKLIVKATVFQHQLPYIHIGSRAKIFPNFFKDLFVWGEVKAIGPPNSSQTDRGFPTFSLTIELDHESNELISGMGVSVKIIADDQPVEERQ
jgi:multidrug resistance efflux pump